MIDQARFQEIMVKYRSDFGEEWKRENYKWRAIQHFQDHWDIHAEDFYEMLHNALDKTDNLLTNAKFYPRGMIEEFAQKDPERVRAMFISLYDESRDFVSRIGEFKDASEVLLHEYRGPETGLNHYQTELTLSVYLWLRYPDKYYIYKFGEVKRAAEKLKSSYKFRKGAYAENLRNCNAFHDEIRALILQDDALISMFRAGLTEEFYPDPELRTLANDIEFYISRYISGKKADGEEMPASSDWWPSLEEYTPGFTREKWVELLNRKDIIGPVWGNALAMFYDYGGEATCKQLADKYGKDFNAIRSSCTALAKNIQKKTGCPAPARPDGGVYYFPILFQGKSADNNATGSYVWRLRQELKEALGDVNILKYLSPKEEKDLEAYWPPLDEYKVDISKEQWKKYIEEVEIPHHKGCVRLLKNLMELGGEASCWRLSKVYGGSPYQHNASTMNIGRRAKSYFNISTPVSDGVESLPAIPFLRRIVTEEGKKNMSFKIREELQEALKEIDLSGIDLDAGQEDDTEVNYWWLNANPKIWSFSDMAVGEIQSYTLYNENGNKRRIFQNFLDAKPGELVIGYESYPVKQVVALARIGAEQDGKELTFEKTEGLASPVDYLTLKACPELEHMEYFQNPQGSLFKLTKEEYDVILDLVREENPVNSEAGIEPYSKDQFLSEVYMDESRYETLKSVLLNKKNIILQGAPGVGKTYVAKRLAYSIMGVKDTSRVKMVQFHQSYSYEDFIMGYRPTETGFELRNGIFYQFCQKAANQPSKEFFFIIDEINRGNMSKIFGELMMLIEKQYRDRKITLAYNGLPFSVPGNLYIIGMMNTADRSLAMIDYALRRRFSFFEMKPGFDSKGFTAYQQSLHSDTLDEVIDVIKDLNQHISRDRSLGKGFCIGHSYFCGCESYSDEWLRNIVEYDIIPMLSEYWFDEPAETQKWENRLRGVFQ